MTQQPPNHKLLYHHANSHTLQLPPQYRNPFDLLYEDRTGAINYNYIRSFMPNQFPKTEDLQEALVMRRPRRTRTTFTNAQIAELEQHFLQSRYLSAARLTELANKLSLGQPQVKIWFKNRRRRHKLQTDLHKEHTTVYSSSSVPLSPCHLMSSNTSNDSQCSSHTAATTTMHTLSLSNNSNISSMPNMSSVTIKAKTQNASHFEHYGDTYFYYNNQNPTATTTTPTTPSTASLNHAHVYQYSGSTATASVAQFCPPHTATLQQQQHQHNQQQQSQYQIQQHNYEYHNKDAGGVGNVGTATKLNADYNFNSPYYMRMALKPVAATTSALATNSEVYESLATKNDESPGLSNDDKRVSGGGSKHCVVVSDEMDESNIKTLQKKIIFLVL